MIKPGDLIPIKTVSDLMASATNTLRSLSFRITNLRPGGVFYTLLEVCSQALADLYNLFADVSPQMYVHTATGDWLDLRAAEYNVFRKPALKARGNALFIRDTTDGNLIIPEGTEVATALDANGERLKFIVTEQAVISVGEIQGLAPVEAEFEGAEFNVGSNMITNLLTHINGIIQVTNTADWITREGCDEEDDESLRERTLGAWSELASGGTPGAYESWAKTITGVLVVWVDDNQPRGQGSVDVYITSSAGCPSAELANEVQAYIDTKRPLCANVLVKGPELLIVDFDVVLLVSSGDTELIQTEAEQIIDLMFAYGDTDRTEIRKAALGFGLTKAQVITNLMQIEGVVGVTVNSPDDIFINNSQLFIKGDVILSIEVV